MSVWIRNASYGRGYSSHDHHLRDSDFDAIRGKIFPSQEAAHKAARNLATFGEGRCLTSPIWLDLAPINQPPTQDMIERSVDRLLKTGRSITEDPAELKPIAGDDAWFTWVESDDDEAFNQSEGRAGVYRLRIY